MAVGHTIHRLSQNKDVLVKVIKRINQNFLAATNNDNEIKIWNLSDTRFIENEEGIRTYWIIGRHTGRITSLQVIHNGHGPKATYLVSSSEDKTLRIWIVPAFTEIKCISCRFPIKYFAFGKVGNLQYVYTIHNNGKIRLWSEHTEFLMDELHYNGIPNLKRRNRIIVDHNPNRSVLPLEVLHLIKSFMGDCNS